MSSGSREQRERERKRKLAALRKEERRFNPSARQLQLDADYMDWLTARPEQHGDAPRNDTWEIFMQERRREREAARLKRVAARRREEREWDIELLVDDNTAAVPMSVEHTNTTSSATMQRRLDYDAWLRTLPDPERDDEDPDESWHAFMTDRRREQQEQRNAARRKSTRRGRPIDPNSERQEKLRKRTWLGTAREPGPGRPINPSSERQLKCARDLQKWSAEDAVWTPRITELRALGATNVTLSCSSGHVKGRGKGPLAQEVVRHFWLLPSGVSQPSWAVGGHAGKVPERTRQTLGDTTPLIQGRDYTDPRSLVGRLISMGGMGACARRQHQRLLAANGLNEAL